MQAMVNTHLVVDQGIKAQIFQGNMAVCPQCQEIAVSCGPLFKDNGWRLLGHTSRLHEELTIVWREHFIFDWSTLPFKQNNSLFYLHRFFSFQQTVIEFYSGTVLGLGIEWWISHSPSFKEIKASEGALD